MMMAAAILLVTVLHAEPPPEPDAPPPLLPGANAATSGPAEDPAEDPAARAGALFQAGRFVEAAAAFERAYAERRDPAMLFGQAQALRRAGNCSAAITVFESFIATRPPAPDVEAAQAVIDVCREALAQSPAASPRSAPEPSPAPGDAADRPRPVWLRDVVGGLVLSGGLGLGAVGGGLYGTASLRARDRRESEMAFEQRRRSVQRLGATGIALMATGGAMVVGAVLRYAIIARRLRRDRGGAHVRRGPWVRSAHAKPARPSALRDLAGPASR